MAGVLLIDDDVELTELLREVLRREGLSVEVMHSGDSGLQRAQSGDWDVVVLDVMLPGIGGFEVLRRLRATSPVPVLMLTARGDESSRVQGLELGADDYLPKPFSSRELVARLRAILRRTQTRTTPEKLAELMVIGDVELDSGAHEARRNGERLELTGVEFKLLEILLRAAGEVVPREAIAQQVLGRRLLAYDRSVDTHVSNLRRKLGPDLNGGDRIKTLRGSGYIYAKPAHSAD
jgi:two-component system response regulator CpxR